MLQNGNPTARPLSLSPGGLLPLSQQLNKPTPGAPRGVGARDLLLHLPPYKARHSINNIPPPCFWGISCLFSFPSLLPPQVSRAADCLVPANLAWGALSWPIKCNLLPRLCTKVQRWPKDHTSSCAAGVQPQTIGLCVHMCVPL